VTPGKEEDGERRGINWGGRKGGGMGEERLREETEEEKEKRRGSLVPTIVFKSRCLWGPQVSARALQ